MLGDQDAEPRFPHGVMKSPMFSLGNYDCHFSMWYYMYHSAVKDNNDAILNVAFLRDEKETILWTNEASSGPVWQFVNVTLPHCPASFQVHFISFSPTLPCKCPCRKVMITFSFA